MNYLILISLTQKIYSLTLKKEKHIHQLKRKPQKFIFAFTFTFALIQEKLLKIKLCGLD